MAHARRPFAQLAKLAKKEGLAVKALHYFKRLYDIESYARENQLSHSKKHVLALGRKNFLFMGSPKGAKAGAIFYSLIATCIENNVEPYRYFCTMLNLICNCKTQDDYQACLPQNIKLNSGI